MFANRVFSESYCPDCGLIIPGSENMEQHRAGRKHKNKTRFGSSDSISDLSVRLLVALAMGEQSAQTLRHMFPTLKVEVSRTLHNMAAQGHILSHGEWTYILLANP